ncbi:phage tail protein [Mucilaginibacter sp. KACC 22063]|uniref:phage tail protein n=1 Tax=Mucilaginibacter sp. KACC 22063 TaxID=3025666 RepID=UPI0023670842|nr:tail fiber protein [Mucilaginibacter sp. KACC 22063]WDF53912.1 tail fiber protein [Mucilaginibacter sp. KACC 22063]
MEGYIGEIRLFAGNFAPYSWNLCAGQLLSVAGNTALFAILGTQYGGNGTSTFGLPDFAGRVAVCTGDGLGLSEYVNGESGGTATVTLLQSQMAAHNHLVNVQQTISGTVSINALSAGADQFDPTGCMIAGDGTTLLFSNGTPVPMSPKSISASNFTLPAPTVSNVTNVGGGTAHNNLQPYLGLNYIICLMGIFPSRN